MLSRLLLLLLIARVVRMRSGCFLQLTHNDQNRQRNQRNTEEHGNRLSCWGSLATPVTS